MGKVVLIAIGFAVGAFAASSAHAQVPGRDADPVVLTGASLPKLAGAEPGDVVAFRWSGSAWDQVPVQVDERAAVAFNKVYNFATCSFACNYAGTSNVYTDPDTWTGPDPDAGLDSGDEVAFMAKDSGSGAPGGQPAPAGVSASTRTQVELSDPISGTAGHSVYLFESTTLDPSAGESYVDYDFNLTSGDYKATYAIPDGPNPETSSVETDFYRHDGLTDRWFDRNLKILGRGSTEADILDGDKAQFHPTTCGRSETTFAGYASDQAEGAFVVNTSGPVRAIRSYIGANSGPSTQRTHIYYERRQDIQTNLRVHPIPGIMSFLDYSPAANGMTYRNPNNAGLTIDGVPEAAAASPGGPQWEQVSGPQGTLDIVNRFFTDVAPITITNYFYDDSTPDSGHLQCSGDNQAWGSSGTWVTSALPNTDPRNAAKALTAVRHMFYDAPNQGASQGALRNQQIASSLGVSVDGVAVVPAGPPPGPPAGAAGPPGTKAKILGRKGRVVRIQFRSEVSGATFACRKQIDKADRAIERKSKPCKSPYVLKLKKARRVPIRYRLYVQAGANGLVDPSPAVIKVASKPAPEIP